MLHREDAFGRRVDPLRYVMWTISVSTMCLALYLVAEGLLFQSKDKRTISRAECRELFLDSLLGSYGTFVFGFAGSITLVEESLVPNIACELVSAVCFYRMLFCLTKIYHHVITNQLSTHAARHTRPQHVARPQYVARPQHP